MAEHDEPQDGALLVGVDAESTNSAPVEPDEEKAKASMQIIDEILDLLDLDVDALVRENGEQIVIDIDGPDAGRVIGKKGATLDAIQFLVNKIVNRFPESRRHIVVDSGDYRDRHDKGLISMANREAKKAMQSGRVITLQPMTPRDRRVIHLSLAKFDGVSTSSNGEGSKRRIQIIPAKQKRRAPREHRDD